MDNEINKNIINKGRALSIKYPFLRPYLVFFKKLFFTKPNFLNGVTRTSEIPGVDKFIKTYFGMHIEEKAYWLGVKAIKCPLDLWVYQEIIFDIKPDFIIETGTAHGGSALFLATICDVIKNGTIISIDIETKRLETKHDRIRFLTGSSVDQAVVNQVKSMIRSPVDKVIVILDSDHSKDHVLKEMEIYGKLVSKGSYLIVEDTSVNGHPIAPEHGEGPMEAVQEFLKMHDEFVIDKEREKFLMTFNPNGYLKKIK